MQGGVGVPDDLMALQNVKTVWYTSIAGLWVRACEVKNRLEKKGEECHATQDFCDVMYHGFVFRLVIFTDREEALRKYRLSHEMLSLKDFQRQFLQHSFLPSHITLVKNMALQNPAFLPAVRLAKLWLASQMLSHSIPAFLLEALLIHVFITHQPLTPSRGFLLLLHLLTHFDWKTSTLVINSNSSLTAEAIATALQAIESQRQVSAQAVCLVTPFDLASQCTRLAPDTPSWNHLLRVAQNALRALHRKWEEEEEMKSVFSAPLRDFDVVLTLREDVLSPQKGWVKHVGGKMENRGSAYKCTLAKNVMMDRSRLLIGYNPEECVLEAVEKEVGMGGVVMMNCEFGRKIGISWKPTYFLPLKMSMANVMDCCPLKKGNGGKKEDTILVRSVFDIVKRIEDALGDVLVKVEFV